MRCAAAIAAGVFLCTLAISLPAQTDREAGDAAVAERYVRWALDAVESGRTAEAEDALERASDFADVSSDASYLLALVRMQSHRPIGAVLEALGRARKAARWRLYDDNAAAKLESRALIAVRSFDEALSVLARLPEDADVAYYRLAAVRGQGDQPNLLRRLRAAMDAYPADPRFAAFLFETLSRRGPRSGEQDLVDIVLKRLPPLVAADPRLGYLAAPFVRNPEERRRLVGAYRALGRPDPRSLVPALDLGMVDEAAAVAELFSAGDRASDVALFRAVWNLLRDDAGRQAFSSAFLTFSGSLTEDSDGDGRPESSALYERGRVVRYTYDADQDGLRELELEFQDGLPVVGYFTAMPEAAADPSRSVFARAVSAEERERVRIAWDRYPFVAAADAGQYRYIPVPRALSLAPVRMDPLFDAFLYPERDVMQPRITERTLVSFAASVERPGTLFDGSVERLNMVRGIPQRAVEIIGGRTVAVTEYQKGMPYRQSLDLDADGRMETRRRFRVDIPVPIDYDPLRVRSELEFSESDFDGDGIFEYIERRRADGQIERSWEN